MAWGIPIDHWYLDTPRWARAKMIATIWGKGTLEWASRPQEG